MLLLFNQIYWQRSWDKTLTIFYPAPITSKEIDKLSSEETYAVLPLIVIKAVGAEVLGVSWGNLWPFPNELQLLQLPLECNWILHCSTKAIDLIHSVTQLWRSTLLRGKQLVQQYAAMTTMLRKWIWEEKLEGNGATFSTIGKLFHRKGNYLKNRHFNSSSSYRASLPALAVPFDYNTNRCYYVVLINNLSLICSY